MAKKGKNMTPTTTATAAAAPIKQIKVKRTLFNLSTFKRESQDTTIDTPKKVATTEEVLAALDNDGSKLVTMYNKFAKRQAISDAKVAMITDNLVSPKIISGLTGGFYAKFPLTDDSKAAKAKQREQVYDFVRENPAVHSALKMIAASMAPIDDEDEDEEEESENE